MSRPVPATAAGLYEAAVDVYEQGDAQRALTMLEEMLRLHPAHPGALYMSGSLLLTSGDTRRAVQRLEAADRVLPGNSDILQTLAQAYSRSQRWPEAVGAYQAALRLQRHAGLLNDLGLALKESGRLIEAVAAYREALVLAPDDADLHNNLAIALNILQDYTGAIAAYRHATGLAPGNAGIWANLATLYEQSNQLDEAEAALQQGLVVAPDLENLQLIAASCERRRGDPGQAALRLERQLTRNDLSPVVRRSMEFELGRDYDLLEDADRAFLHVTAANALTPMVWPALRASADTYLADLELRLVQATPDWLRGLPKAPPEERPSPVFLVGFTRSGTTLMDTMLAAHPGVSVMEEAPVLEQLVDRLRLIPGGYPHALARLTADDIRELRALYWQQVDALQGQEAAGALLIDKNPLYTAHGALIQLLFPNARFIFALRHPCDVALSCFMQAFGNVPVLENFRDLPNTARTYHLVMQLWSRYRGALDMDVHTLRYEGLVADKRAEMASLLDFLGLEWDPVMEDHTRQAKLRGRIYTPSYHQVAKPVYRDSVGRWRRYREHFGPALESLRPYVESFGYSLDEH